MVDSDHPAVIAFAARTCARRRRPRARGRAVLRGARRPALRPLPHRPERARHEGQHRAGQGLRLVRAQGRGAGRGVPRGRHPGARRLCRRAQPPQHRALRQNMGSDLFVWHGYTDIWLDGSWVKATPAFNIELCDRFGLLPLEFDGRADSIYHPFDRPATATWNTWRCTAPSTTCRCRRSWTPLPCTTRTCRWRRRAQEGDFEADAAAERAGSHREPPADAAHAQRGQQFLLADRSQFHRPPVAAAQPADLREVLEDLFGQLAREMVAALGPVQASVGITTVAVGQARAQPPTLQPLSAGVRKFVAIGAGQHAAFAAQAVEQRHGQLSGQVPVAAAREAQAPALWVGPGAVVLAALGHQGQRFQRMRDLGIGEADSSGAVRATRRPRSRRPAAWRGVRWRWTRVTDAVFASSPALAYSPDSR